MTDKGWMAKLAGFYNSDGRRQPRLVAEFTGVMAGPTGSMPVTGVDASRRGAGVLSPEAFPIGTLVFLRISSLGVMGFAYVRHCSPRDNGYFLGLQFRGALVRERDENADWSWNVAPQAGSQHQDEARS